MCKAIYIILLLFLPVMAEGQSDSLVAPEAGDLIFENGNCGPLCRGINEVTPAIRGRHFSHVGIVMVENDTVFVVEAIGDKVQRNTLKIFLARTKEPVFIGRLKARYRYLADSAVAFALGQLGTPYDDAFLYGNGKYYCSELVYDAFKAADKGKPFFKMQPMTFKKPGAKTYFPGWVKYYQKLGIAIPEGQPGCNPGSLGQSDKIEIYGLREM